MGRLTLRGSSPVGHVLASGRLKADRTIESQLETRQLDATFEQNKKVSCQVLEVNLREKKHTAKNEKYTKSIGRDDKGTRRFREFAELLVSFSLRMVIVGCRS